MAESNFANVSLLPFKAGAAIGQNRLVKQDSTAGQVVVTTAITEAVVGVATIAAAAAGDQVTVQYSGVAKCVASAAISLGAQVMPTVSGSGKVATAAGATAVSCGIALEAATADGDVISVLLRPSVNSPANS